MTIHINPCQYYGPDYELNVRSSNMENANSYEYLEKIKIAVIENLKRTAAVPSVQMQDVPRQSFGMSDEQEAEMDDLDADENKDVRMTQRQWEKRVERRDEFDESDDEDMARANGVFKPNGHSLQETDFGHVNNDDTMEVDSGLATPAELAELEELNAEGTVDNNDTMIDDGLTQIAEAAKAADAAEAAEAAEAAKVAETTETTETEVEKSTATEQLAQGDNHKIDSDGDVDMAEVATGDDKTTDATIKKEEVDGMSATEAEPKQSPAVEGAEPAGNKETLDAKQGASGSPEAAASEAKPAEEAPATEAPHKDAVAADKTAAEDETKA